MNEMLVEATQIPLLSYLEVEGAWREVVGLELNKVRQIVMIKLDAWGAVVDYPATALVEVRAQP